MKTFKRSLVITVGLFSMFPILGIAQKAEATMLSTKPVAFFSGMHQPDLQGSTTILSPVNRLEGSKPVLKMIGTPPETTLTRAHIRQEAWVYAATPFEATKPVLGMLAQ